MLQREEWLRAEVEAFRHLERHDRILALLVEGEPAASFPRSLVEIRGTITDAQHGTTERIEEVDPLAARQRALQSVDARHEF